MHLALRLWNRSQLLRPTDQLTSGTTTVCAKVYSLLLPISFIVGFKHVCTAGVCAFFPRTVLLLDTNMIVTVLWLLDQLDPQETTTNRPCRIFTCTSTHKLIAKSSQSNRLIVRLTCDMNYGNVILHSTDKGFRILLPVKKLAYGTRSVWKWIALHITLKVWVFIKSEEAKQS